jgi:hypothetical protein
MTKGEDMSIRDLARTVDERLADLGWAEYVLAMDIGHAEDAIRRNAGQRFDWREKQWDGTLEEALAAEVPAYMADKQAYAKAARDKAIANHAQVTTEYREMHAVYLEEKWNRAFLVKNANGHVHKSRSCSTCFESTEFAWLTEFSGATETEIVEAAGEMACTVCYPSAPAEVLNRPSTIVNEEKVAKEAARAEREAKKAERDAKRRAAAPTASGEPLMLPNRYGREWMEEIKTERTAVSEWHSAVDYLGFTSDEAGKARLRERMALIEEALAGKHGVTVEEKRAELEAKYAKRRRS